MFFVKSAIKFSTQNIIIKLYAIKAQIEDEAFFTLKSLIKKKISNKGVIRGVTKLHKSDSWDDIRSHSPLTTESRHQISRIKMESEIRIPRLQEVGRVPLSQCKLLVIQL